MLLNQVLFIFTFLPVLLILYRVVPENFRNPLLLIASLVFYAWGNQLFILVLLGSMAVNYVGSMLLEDQYVHGNDRLRFTLWGFVILNVAALLAMKYYGKLECPMGVTFFTLMQISYLFGVANGEISLEANVLNYALCVSFFPMMSAGPVLEFSVLQKQMEGREPLTLATLGEGLMWFVRGLFKVSVLAGCAGVVYTGLTESRSVLGTWLMCAAFAFQIYFVLGGYSDMAKGLGVLFGFEIPKNFQYPIMSRSFNDFIKRWYITLTDFLFHHVRDLSVKRNNRGLALVWGSLLVTILMGCFYGNQAGTLIWGGFIGVMIILEKKVYGRVLRRVPVAGHVYYLLLSLVGWGLFTGATVADSLDTVKRMIGIGASGFADHIFAYYLLTNFVLWIVLLIASLPYVHRLWSGIFTGMNSVLNIVNAAVYLILFMISVAFIVTGSGAVLIPSGVFVI